MKTKLLYLVLFLLPIISIAQEVHTVDNRIGTTALFNNVQDAIDAAAEGDYIYIHPSETNYGNISIRKTLHIRGLGHNPELNGGEHAKLSNISLDIDSVAGTSGSDSTISGIETATISVSAANTISDLQISNCYITIRLDLINSVNTLVNGNIIDNSEIRFGPIQSGNIITNNIFNWTNVSSSVNLINGMNDTNIFSNNVVLIKDTSNIFRNSNLPVVKNCLFLFADDANSPTSVILENSTIYFQNCLTFSYGGQTIDTLNGINNLDNVNPQLEDLGTPEDPLFSYDKNYAISVGSPAQNAGEDGTDLGIFGASFNFIMRGYPFDLPYPTSINIANPIIQAGATMQVELTAEGN